VSHAAGAAGEIADVFVESPDVRVINLIGGVKTARLLAERAGRTLKRTVLELGGYNPMIILDDVDVDYAVRTATFGSFFHQGQICLNTRRIIIQRKIYAEFLEKFVARTKTLPSGDPLNPKTLIGPLITRAALELVDARVKEAVAKGAKLLCGGNRLDSGEYQHGWFMQPTVFGDVDRKMRIAQEEIFGPVVSVMPCDGLEDAISIANEIEYGLSSSIYTRDVNRAFQAMRDLYAGITYINAPTIGAEVHLPFGGVKATGNGHREGGIGAIDFYTEWKAVYVDYSDRLQKAQIDRPE